MSSIYEINKGINKPIEFKGIKAQYIGYMAAGLVILMLVFAVLYLIGIYIYICIGIVSMAGAWLMSWVSACSRKYGRYGLMKKAARRSLPAFVSVHSRKIFLTLHPSAYVSNQNDR